MQLKPLLLGMCLTPAVFFGAPPESSLSQLQKDHTHCAFSLYEANNPSQDNFIFSPYSISTCLSMVYLGARGETQTQMEKALQLTLDRKTLSKATASLQEALFPRSAKPADVRLINANSLWVDKSIFLLTDFRYPIEQQFKAALNKVDFSQTEEALCSINHWVNAQTQNTLPQILSSGDLDPHTRLVLINALCFQGSWLLPFDTSQTHDWPFHPTPETSTLTQMMHQEISLPYYENELIQIAALPFQGEGNINLLILMPKSAEHFDSLLSDVPSHFTQWISSLTSTRIDLKLPKWAQTTRLDLNKTLQEMGMEEAFSSEANFTGIDGMRDLCLSKVIHQAFFSIDEKGVVASAATAATMNLTCAAAKEPPPSFYADHPFLYFIVDLKSQEILFMGTMAQPGSH